MCKKNRRFNGELMKGFAQLLHSEKITREKVNRIFNALKRTFKLASRLGRVIRNFVTVF
jgi:hypothetical protein